MRGTLGLGGVVGLLAVILGSAAAPGGAPKERQETADLVVINRYVRPSPILVTLFFQGKAVRSREVHKGDKEPAKVRWSNLPVGPYEIHFEAEGFKPFIKRFVLSREDKDFEVQIKVSKEATVLGGGLSLDGLCERVKKLEQANADLRAQVERLQQEIHQLKKK
jgi:hypothetical protein